MPRNTPSLRVQTSTGVFVPMPGSTGSAGGGTTFVMSGGSIFAWGANQLSQLAGGRPSGTNSLLAVPLPAVPPSTAFAVGRDHGCVRVSTTNDLRCWGANGSGQLARGTTSMSSPVVQVATDMVMDPMTPTSFDCHDKHCCAVLPRSPTAAACWGGYSLPTGLDYFRELRAAQVPTPGVTYTEVKEFASGKYHDCLLTQGGAVWCWGSNHRGQLGRDVPRDPVPGGMPPTGLHPPGQVTGLPLITSIASGDEFTCAVTRAFGSEQTIYCWGANDAGQLGADSTVMDSHIPLQVREEL